MFGLSFVELAIVAVLALLLLGPDQLPGIAKTVGKTLRDLRRASDDLRSTFETEMNKLEREVQVPAAPRAPGSAAPAQGPIVELDPAAPLGPVPLDQVGLAGAAPLAARPQLPSAAAVPLDQMRHQVDPGELRARARASAQPKDPGAARAAARFAAQARRSAPEPLPEPPAQAPSAVDPTPGAYTELASPGLPVARERKPEQT